MTSVQLFGFDGSTYLKTVQIACARLAIPYETLSLEFGKPSHLALHPFAKMPAMRHGDVSLYETAAILSYLNDLSEDALLVPEEPVQRALMWQGVSAAIDYGYPALVRSTFTDDTTTVDLKPVEQCLAAFANLLGDNSWLAGDTVSFADVIIGPMVAHFVHAAPSGQAVLDRHEKLADWNRRMAAD